MSSVKTLAFWTVVVLSAMLLFQVVRAGPDAKTPQIPYSTFIAQAEAGQIARVAVTGSRIEGEYRDGKGRFRLTGPNDPAVFLGVLHDKGVEVQFRNVADGNLPLQLLGTWSPLILLGALWFFMIRQQQRQRRPPPQDNGGSLGPSGGLG
jgi:cell division protease FtsH